MYEVFALGYEFLSEFLPFLLALVLLRRHGSRGGYLWTAFFGLYIMAVFYVTDPGTLYGLLSLKPRHLGYLAEHINLIPFSREIQVVGYGLNVVMFLPLGFLIPLIWKELGKLRYILAAGCGLSTLIEVSQLLSLRGTDVDDVIMNTLGAVLGYGLYRLCSRLTGSRFQQQEAAGELPVLILAIFLGRFFLFYRMGLIEIFYGV